MWSDKDLELRHGAIDSGTFGCWFSRCRVVVLNLISIPDEPWNWFVNDLSHLNYVKLILPRCCPFQSTSRQQATSLIRIQFRRPLPNDSVASLQASKFFSTPKAGHLTVFVSVHSASGSDASTARRQPQKRRRRRKKPKNCCLRSFKIVPFGYITLALPTSDAKLSFDWSFGWRGRPIADLYFL